MSVQAKLLAPGHIARDQVAICDGTSHYPTIVTTKNFRLPLNSYEAHRRGLELIAINGRMVSAPKQVGRWQRFVAWWCQLIESPLLPATRIKLGDTLTIYVFGEIHQETVELIDVEYDSSTMLR